MKIRSHLKNHPYQPEQAWPKDCMIQWGGSGLVVGKESSYTTAFFEAFPTNGAGGFLRGEGKTLSDAETAAFSKYLKQKACFDTGGHAWSRNRPMKGFEDRERQGRKVPKVDTYLNGGTFCKKCGGFETTMKPVVALGAYKAPIRMTELSIIMMGALHGQEPSRHERRIALRAKLAGIDLPDPNSDENDYDEACEEAIADWYVKQKDVAGSESALEQFFDRFTKQGLDRIVERRARREAAGLEV